MGKLICVFGSGSDVGKSATAAALGRIFSDRGLRVAPFKAQNMSNNAGVVPLSGGAAGELGEIGRAQVIQAEACRAAAETDMNPVLLKPCSDRSSQVVLCGRVLAEVAARDLWKKGGAAQSPLRAAAFAALDRLLGRHDAVVLEGAGSCAEVNLRDRDFVNCEAALHAQRAGHSVAAVLVVDIEKGGVFAQVVGTLACMRPADRSLIRAVVVNKFRGDPSLFADGAAWLEEETGLPILGVVPFFNPHDIRGDGSRCVLGSEDGLHPTARVDPPPASADRAKVRVAVVLLPRIANLTDLAAVESHPSAQVDWLRAPRPLDGYAMVVLPGSKSVVRDIDWLEAEGWLAPLRAYAASPNAALVGLCGGYQMLGRGVADPDGHDGRAVGRREALGLLPVETRMTGDKTLTQVEAVWEAPHLLPPGTPVAGYEIHTGETALCADAGPSAARVVRLPSGPDGCAVATAGGGLILGTYLHGVFDMPAADTLVCALAERCGLDAPGPSAAAAARPDPYAALADHFLAAIPPAKREVLFSFAE